MEKAKRVLKRDNLQQDSAIVELPDAERQKEELHALKETAAAVVAKGSVTLSKAEMAKLVVGENLEKVENRMDAVASRGDLRRYNLLLPQARRLEGAKATVEDLALEAEELVVEADIAVMVQESLLDCVDVQEKFLETAGIFRKLTENQTSLIDSYEANWAKIKPAREDIRKVMNRIRSVNEVTRRLEEPPSSDVIKAFKEHRKRLGLPP
jgi:hypothetical protein